MLSIMVLRFGRDLLPRVSLHKDLHTHSAHQQLAQARNISIGDHRRFMGCTVNSFLSPVI